MKKNHLIISVTILLLAVGLSGCTSTNENTNDKGFTGHQEMFIGKWYTNYEYEQSITDEYWTFEDDGDIEVNSMFKGEPDTYYLSYWFLEEEDNIIVIYGNKPDCIEYRFFDGGNTLKLWEGGNLKLVLQRVSLI